MSSCRLLRLSLSLRPTLCSVTATRNCGWARDWKPGPVPKTEEERIAAAKKYYLIPEDYEVNDEDMGYGDYPKLPKVGMDARDPYEDLDYYYWRTNYGEPKHTNADFYTADRHDPNEVWRYTPRQMAWQTISFFGLWFLFLSLFEYYDIRLCMPYKPKQWPGPGKVHYTFEAEQD